MNNVFSNIDIRDSANKIGRRLNNIEVNSISDEMSDLYILVNSEPAGPFSLQDLQKMVQTGEVTGETLFAEDGASSWEKLSTVIQLPIPPEVEKGSEIDPAADIIRCEELSESRQSLSTYITAREWLKKVEDELKALPATLQCLDQLIATAFQKASEEKARFNNQPFLKRAFGSHADEESATRRVSYLRQQRDHLAGLIERLRFQSGLVPDSPERRDSIVKEIRHHIKELKAKKKEATLAMTEIRREARVASDGAGKTWLGLYDSSLAADQRRGIRHGKEDALRPYEDSKETVERQIIGLEKRLIWLESFE